jgi:hypothetical protein
VIDIAVQRPVQSVDKFSHPANPRPQESEHLEATLHKSEVRGNMHAALPV